MTSHTNAELESRVRDLAQGQAWNHSFTLAPGVETASSDQVSHGKNLVKWKRIEPLIDEVDVGGKRVLDVGCNEGFFSLALARRAAQVVGIDADARRIEKARFVQDVLKQPGVQFECANIYDDAFDRLPTFDFCLCLGFLHRVPDPFSALARLTQKSDLILLEWKALKVGPHDEPFAYYTPGAFDQRDFYGTQYWLMSMSCVEAMLRRLGFDRFRRVDDPRFRRAILVGGRVPNAVFEQPDVIRHRGRVRTLLSHTKRYFRTVIRVLDGRINA